MQCYEVLHFYNAMKVSHDVHSWHKDFPYATEQGYLKSLHAMSSKPETVNNKNTFILNLNTVLRNITTTTPI